MWHKEAFEALENHLERFLQVGEDVLKGIDKCVGCMLVEINVTKCFFDEIEIE